MFTESLTYEAENETMNNLTHKDKKSVNLTENRKKVFVYAEPICPRCPRCRYNNTTYTHEGEKNLFYNCNSPRCKNTFRIERH